MNRRQLVGVVLAVCVLALLLSSLALAQSGGLFALRASTVGGGGGASSGGSFQVRGTAGQPDAGLVTGGSFSLNGGFWHPTGSVSIYLPQISR